MPLRLLLIIVLFRGFNAFSQTPVISQLYITNPTPSYILSPDNKTLGVSCTSDDRKNTWFTFIDLQKFLYKPAGSVSMVYSDITPDLQSAFGNDFNDKGYTGGGGWISYNKYMSWYYPSSTSTEKMQWADKHIILAKRNDNNLLTAGKLIYVNKKNTSYISLQDLQVTDPVTGKTVSTILKGEFLQLAKLWRPGQNPMLINNDNLLLWQSESDITTMKLDGSRPVRMSKHIFPMQAISGKWGMSVKMDDKSTQENKQIKKLIVDLETGAIVYDKLIPINNANGYWCTASGNNGFYSLNGLNSVLYKEEWTGSQLLIKDSFSLKSKEILPYKVWLSYTNDYKLVVSESTGKVLMLPLSWSQYTKSNNEIFIWNLDNGNLVQRNPEYIRPPEYFVAQRKMESTLPATSSSIPFNTLVRAKGGGPYYVLLSQDPATKKYWVSRFMPNKRGHYDVINESKEEGAFSTLTTQVVSSTVCSLCNGGGKMNVNEQRTSEKTDKMIYTQVTTTKTENVNVSKSCSQCKGLGFAGVN